MPLGARPRPNPPPTHKNAPRPHRLGPPPKARGGGGWVGAGETPGEGAPILPILDIALKIAATQSCYAALCAAALCTHGCIGV
jgi:hypothetical protein